MSEGNNRQATLPAILRRQKTPDFGEYAIYLGRERARKNFKYLGQGAVATHTKFFAKLSFVRLDTHSHPKHDIQNVQLGLLVRLKETLARRHTHIPNST